MLFPAILMAAAQASGGGVSAYTRTAFVSSSGNDGTAALNNDALPYLTQDAAVNALAAAYPGQTTTLRYLTDITGDIALSGNLDTLLLAGLTLLAHTTTKTITGTVSFGDVADALLTLTNVSMTALTKDPTIVGVAPNAGTITGSGTVLIGTLTIAGGDAADAGAGTAGGAITGTPDGPAQPPPNSPPDTGTAGGDADANGGNGLGPADGGPGWLLTLVGSGTITSLIGTGGSGGDGGNGGAGGTATGGAGGMGGDSNSGGTEDGGTGGAGGNATANGGNGVNGAAGGNGSIVTKAAGWTITSSTLTGGAGGAAGTGGLAGTATGGAGGVGGAGANGGNQGATGATGSATNTAGSDGSAGANGTNGSII